MKEREAHATLAYLGSGLGFTDERLARFAVMQIRRAATATNY